LSAGILSSPFLRFSSRNNAILSYPELLAQDTGSPFNAVLFLTIENNVNLLVAEHLQRGSRRQLEDQTGLVLPRFQARSLRSRALTCAPSLEQF